MEYTKSLLAFIRSLPILHTLPYALYLSCSNQLLTERRKHDTIIYAINTSRSNGSSHHIMTVRGDDRTFFQKRSY